MGINRIWKQFRVEQNDAELRRRWSNRRWRRASRLQFQGDESRLARLSMSTCIKGIDRRGGCVQVQQLPRKKTGTANEEFYDCGTMLAACVKASNGFAPVSLACNGHLSYTKLNQFLLGQLPQHQYSAIAFFEECVPASGPTIPLFGFKVMKFSPSQSSSKQASKLFGCIDPKHILKAMSRGIRTPGRNITLQPGFFNLFFMFFLSRYIVFVFYHCLSFPLAFCGFLCFSYVFLMFSDFLYFLMVS